MNVNIPKIIFIIPYRNREPQLIHFKKYMEYILEDIPNNNYEIYFAHQCDKRPFNRGAIKNIGFIAMKEKYPNDYKNITFVFNDIDTIPCIKNLFDYTTKIGTIKHFFGYKTALGGIVSVTGYDFELMNGFPNYWGWGLEDTDLQIRAFKYNIKIDRSIFYNYDSHMIISIFHGFNRIHSKQQPWRSGINNTDGFKNIKNLNYIYDKDMINISYFTTDIDYINDNYTNEIARSIIPLDKKFKPKNILESKTNFQPHTHNGGFNLNKSNGGFNLNKSNGGFNLNRSNIKLGFTLNR